MSKKSILSNKRVQSAIKRPSKPGVDRSNKWFINNATSEKGIKLKAISPKPNRDEGSIGKMIIINESNNCINNKVRKKDKDYPEYNKIKLTNLGLKGDFTDLNMSGPISTTCLTSSSKKNNDFTSNIHSNLLL
jgi:hypothetical protein